MREIFKRQIKDFLGSGPDRDRPSLTDELRQHADEQLREGLLDARDPGRHERAAAEEQARLEEIRNGRGSGQAVLVEGYPGEWEALGILSADETAVTFELVDRVSGGYGQLGATDDGSVVLDVPDDQFSTRGVAAAMSYSPPSAGLRLAGAVLRSDGRQVRVSCDLSAKLDLDSAGYSG
jgi:hypothetical protein